MRKNPPSLLGDIFRADAYIKKAQGKTRAQRKKLASKEANQKSL